MTSIPAVVRLKLLSSWQLPMVERGIFYDHTDW